MDEEKFITLIAKNVYETNNFCLKGKDSMLVNDITRKESSFSKEFSKVFLTKDLNAKLPNEAKLKIADILTSPDDCINLGAKVFNRILRKLKKESEGKTEEKIEAVNRDSRYYELMHHVLLRDLTTKTKIVYDTRTNSRTNIEVENYEAWVKKINREDDKELKKIVNNSELLVELKYDPQDITIKKDVIFNGQTVTRYNLHVAPEWRENEIKHPKLPERFVEFFDHLFVSKEGKDYVLDWMHHMIVSRNLTYLLLNGAKGIGKGIFADICRRLVGTVNYGIIGDSVWNTPFNGELRFKRLCFFDEHQIKGSQVVSRMKQYLNEWIPINEKGKTADPTYHNCMSGIIANNDYFDCYDLEPGDRRFSVPELTDVPLLKLWDVKETMEFARIIEEDDEFIGNIGWFLLKREPEYSVAEPYKGAAFYNIIERNLSDWKRNLVLAVKEGEFELEGYTLDKLRNDFDIPSDGGKRHIAEKTIQAFCDEAKDKDLKPYLKYVREEREGKKQFIYYANRPMKKKEIELKDDELEQF